MASVCSCTSRARAIKETTSQMFLDAYVLVNLSNTGNVIDEMLKPSIAKKKDFLKPYEGSDLEGAISQATADIRQTRTLLEAILALNGTIYGVLNTYILSLLFALLGAAAYGLRHLSVEIFGRTFRASYATWARAVLAVIVGFAIGLFSDFTKTLSLTPLAWAFLAGYAVEPFFMFLDGILQAAQKPRSSTT
jgi:hypothetical protein